MKKLLHIDTSANLDNSNSRQLTQLFIEGWKASNPEGQVISRDLVKQEIPHLNGTTIAAFYSAPEEHTEEMKAGAQLSQELVDELKSADEIVVGVPMYNFGIPSTLKSYIDHIARAGLTFQYTAEGPKGMIEGKTLTFINTRGGIYEGTPMDHQAPYLKTFFEFLGFTDIRFVNAEGMAMNAEEGLAKAKTEVKELLAA